MARSHPWAVVAALLALAAVAACGGGRRPPAVAGAGGGPAAATPPGASGLPGEAPEPVGEGPDLAPVDAEDFTVSDPETGEGGPLSDVHFDYDQATLTVEAQGILEKHALWLQNHRDAQVLVEGHCDERGTAEYNLALGERRAAAVQEYLLRLGVDAGRLRTVSYGKERPLDPASGEQAWARNRRAHFVVTR